MKSNSFKPQLLLVSILALPLTTGCGSRAAVAVAPDEPHTLTVTGEGEASAAPDLATLRLGVEERAPTADVAMEMTNRRMATVIGALKGKGVLAEDIQTMDLSVYFERTDGHPGPPPQPTESAPEPEPARPAVGEHSETRGAAPVKKSGEEKQVERMRAPDGYYVVRNTVVVSVHDLARLGEVIGAAMQAGANNLHGLELTLEDPHPLNDQARRRAVARAMEKAQQLAKEAGVSLGPIIEVSETGASHPMPRPASRAVKMESADVPVERGQLSVTENVQVVFSIGR